MPLRKTKRKEGRKERKETSEVSEARLKKQLVDKMEGKGVLGSTDYIQNWSCHELATHLRSKGHPEPYIQALTVDQQLDGKGALLLSEDDLKSPSIGIKTVGELKRLYFDILELQQQEYITNPRISSLLMGLPYSSPSLQPRASHPNLGGGSGGGSFEHPALPPDAVGALATSTKKKHRRQVTFDQDSTSDESQLDELISAKILKKRRPLIQNDSSASEGESLVGNLLNFRNRKHSALNSVNPAPSSSSQATTSGGPSSLHHHHHHHHQKSSSLDGGNGGGTVGIGGGGAGSVNASPSHSNADPTSRRTSAASTSSTPGGPRPLRPEFSKALVAMGYVFIVTWITALVMVIVHDRVPDMEKYPPLPDLFLDNMPHIPWAFEMCEITGTILLSLWLGVLFFHKHRMILLRRFFALSGTVFLLRCFTMLITSLSVPGTHLKCNPRPYGDWKTRLYNAYLIWRGAGMSIQGVRTCGDYMFSGHTVALTMLNFFVTEYTTRRLYFVHTFSWLLNTFGIFFILAAHEHYSIDVFIAFYITSRLFLYYHTLANNSALLQRDSKRTKIWFPLFSFFESGVDGPVPNLYEWPITFRRIKILIRELIVVIETKWRGKFFNEGGFFRGRSFFIRPNTGGSPVDHSHVN